MPKSHKWQLIKDNIDLWILLILAVVFAALGITGIVDDKILNPLVIALLGAIAYSQIRSRNLTTEVTRSWKQRRTELFLKSFPEEYENARSSMSQSYFFAGISMKRTLPIVQPHLVRVLQNGGSVRILLPNPQNGPLLQMIASSRGHTDTASSRRSIENSLADARQMQALHGEGLRVRLTDVLPRLGINAMELDHPGASIMIQMYEHSPKEESAPIFFLTHSDKDWFSHFHEHINRLWDSGNDFLDSGWTPPEESNSHTGS